jgi:hypothetical protein
MSRKLKFMQEGKVAITEPSLDQILCALEKISPKTSFFI